MAANGDPRLRLDIHVELDEATQQVAAWCDQLDVATSAGDMDELTLMMLDALLLAARFVEANQESMRPEALEQIPYAHLVLGSTPAQFEAMVREAIQLRASGAGAEAAGVRPDAAVAPHDVGEAGGPRNGPPGDPAERKSRQNSLERAAKAALARRNNGTGTG